MKTRIFLDMDGVMVDFDSGACAAHGVTPAWLAERRTPGQWSIVDPLGVSLDTFWDRINDQGETFWLGLQPQPWLRELLHLVDTITDDWYVVSSPDEAAVGAVYSGKVKWLKRYFGKSFNRFIPTPHKHLLAGNGILIDDHQTNVNEFVRHGGQAVVFPSIGNNLYPHRDRPVYWLSNQAQLSSLTNHFHISEGTSHAPQIS